MKPWLESRSKAEIALVRERAGTEVDNVLDPLIKPRRPITFARVWRKVRHEGLRIGAFSLGGRRWVAAVNNAKEHGHWTFHVCRDPKVIDQELAHLASSPAATSPLPSVP